MTKTQILKKIFLQIWYFILAYFTEFIIPKIKEAFIKSKEHFIEYLWSSIKENFKAHAETTIQGVESFFKSDDYTFKEKVITDALFEKVKLPVFLRLFKPLLKKLLKDKVHNFIRESLNKIHKRLDKMA
jgi:hypothetical protein